MNFILVPNQNISIQSTDHQCFSRNTILNQLNDSDRLNVLETGEGIYVIPEFSNLKCVGKVIDYVIDEENLLIYIGTNPKATKLVFVFSLLIFVLYSLFFRSVNFQILIGLSFFVFLISFIYFFLPTSEYLNYFVFGLFVIS